MPWFYYVGKAIVRMLLPLLTRWQVRGRENIPGQGPLLIVSNHLNLADPPIIGVSLSRKVMFMAKEELFRPRLSGYFIRNIGAFPVRRGRLDREALYQAEQLLAQGWALVTFPNVRYSLPIAARAVASCGSSSIRWASSSILWRWPNASW